MNTTVAARPSFSLPEFKSSRMGQREPEFIAWVSILLAHNIQSYVELGTGHAHYIHAIGVPRVVTVDINTPQYGVIDAGVTYLSGNSYDIDTLKRTIDALGGLPDVVFIDADHDGDAPRRDFDLWYPVAQKLVGFHDILIPNIAQRIWPEIAFRHPSVELIGRDLASAQAWQGMGTSPDGRISGGGIGVIWK
jgi:hypothetical protein